MVATLKEKGIFELAADNNIISTAEKGFVQYSKRQVMVPPVGELLFDNPKGDCFGMDSFFRIGIGERKQYILNGLDRIKEALNERFNI